MLSTLIRHALSVVGLCALATAASAQTLPTPQQAQQAARDPALAARIQQMVQGSGLTPEQIRDRLRAQGYSEGLLDSYLGGRPDSSATVSNDVLNAVRALGLADSVTVDSVAAAARARRRSVERSDNDLLDSLQSAMKDDSTRNAIRALLESRQRQRAVLDSGFTLFGFDLFRRDRATYEADVAGTVDPNYRFGPGDELALIITGGVERSYRLSVARGGFVVIPDVGTVNVAGLTRAQLEEVLYDRLGRVYSGVRRGPGASTHFYLDVPQVGANQIFVTGDVVQPSAYRVSRAATAMTALYMAGGPSETGSLRNVQVKRNGQVVATLDVYDYALSGDRSGDVRLENGDIVFVPARGGQVRVAGAVIRPGTYEVRPTETVAQILSMAGGFRETADRRSVQLERILPPADRTTAGTDRRVVDVASDRLTAEPARAGDVLRVREISRRVANRVSVTGNVWSPGFVGLQSGMRLSEALRRVGGLKPDSYLGQVLVSRLRADSTREMLRSAVFDTTGRAVNDIVLSDGDEIRVFSISTFRPDRYITIGGSVRKPGRVPFREGMTLRDAVLLANGLTEGALLTDAEIARLPENRAAGVTATTHLVPLDSTYLFERGPDGRYVGPPGIPAPVARAPEVPLEPYDAILIKQQPDWGLQRTVVLAGEVRYPGEYTLTTKTEKIADVIARAGGLTASAYPAGVVLTRERNRIGRIGVDLPLALRDARSADNLPLVDGDSIFIPTYTPVVTIRGAVNAPVAVAYVPGANIDYYVRAAGGANSRGDFGGSYVSQPGGRVETRHRRLMLWTSKPIPQPGAAVIVPEKEAGKGTDWSQFVASTTSIVGSIVAIVAILKR